ncbi:MAG: eukaryotic-like serine/threonine-protein kinase [Blastocatellia bacterium]|jgi:serine/threonine protein kinase/Flp pilus assembly protein TadD|nr:eukaryotic-like serine/threonine-protein kinase [Blastocatellia bacterium]
MSQERWQQVEEVFQSALDLEPDERARYLDEKCAGDAELLREVEVLLRQHEAAGDFLESPVYERSDLQSLPPTLTSEEPDPVIGERIGAYRIEREIGRGGMGTVYKAVRADGEFRQRVAIKLVKRGMDTDFILQRFRNERQILAALEHPHIGHLLGGGTTTDDRPYFVMEYIEGQPLYQYCDTHRLSIRERLELFSLICDAVHYAHRKLVVHRDLKPSNILVTSNGSPRLLDFGIAKLLDPELISDATPQTATALRMMTMEYASPEQVEGEAVTFLSDVYSLGVILFELLCGHRPYRFRNRAPHEMARAIIEDEPERPSAALVRVDKSLLKHYATREASALVYLAEARAQTLDGLQRELVGNLDNITLKALRKEPAARYQSAEALQSDITRCLEGRPVNAPHYFPSVFPERSPVSKAAASSTKAIAVLPLKILNLGTKMETGESYLGVGLADALITRLSRVRSLAVRPTSAILRYGDETTDPLLAGRELVVDFVLDGRIKIAGERVRVSLQLLDVAQNTSVWANQFDESFVDALELEDSISAKVSGAILPRLAQDEEARLKKRGTDNAEAFAAFMRGRYFWNQFTPESLPKALASFEKAIALDARYAPPYVGLADFYNWASIYGILPPGECYEKSRAAALRALELDDSLAEAYAALGLITESLWSWSEAERLYQRAVELNPNYSLAHEWHASLLIGTGRFEEGMKAIRRAEELDPLSLRAMTLTAWTIYQCRRYPEAVAKAEQIIELDKDFPQGHLQLGNALIEAGDAVTAVAALRKAALLMPDSALPKYALCFALVAAGQRDEARRIVAEIDALAAARYIKPYFIALAYVAVGEKETALALLEKAFDERDPWLVWLGTEPKLDSLRRDSRFQRLFKQTRNPLASSLV